MFEYHGWITLRMSAGGSDEDDEWDDLILPETAARVEERIRALDSPDLLQLRRMNGELFLHLGGFRNHADPEIPALFREVGRLAPGSFGVLYIHDDEHPVHSNEFRVLRLVRGEVTEHRDALLSPCIPVLEDPWIS
ncbi:Imm7 family immunity protein [Kitasatospora sp. NPDC049285]|uniref:Imm7 family immunity protein n=1 Tax=Kitasatospora sp. NPDC049285 TaxID=3157096 RepID=UPI00342F90DB